MYCMHCGACIPNGSKFCMKCGGELPVFYAKDNTPSLEKLYKLARWSFDHNEYNEAKNWYKKVLIEDPDNWEPCYFYELLNAWEVTEFMENVQFLDSIMKGDSFKNYLVKASGEENPMIRRENVRILVNSILVFLKYKYKSYYINVDLIDHSCILEKYDSVCSNFSEMSYYISDVAIAVCNHIDDAVGKEYIDYMIETLDTAIELCDSTLYVYERIEAILNEQNDKKNNFLLDFERKTIAENKSTAVQLLSRLREEQT